MTLQENLINIKTENGYVMRALFDFIGKFCDEINITFLGDGNNVVPGIKILMADEHLTIMLCVKLNAVNFINYYAKQNKLNIVVDLSKLNKFMKNCNQSCILSLSVDKYVEQEYPEIKFHLHDSINSLDKIYCQISIDPDDYMSNRMPKEATFEMTATMDITDLKNACDEIMTCNSKYVEIICSNKEIIFQCTNYDGQKFSKIFNNDKVNILLFDNDDENIKIREIYDLRYLEKIKCCDALCSSVKLYLRNSYPLFIEINVGLLGKMMFGLCPISTNI